MLTGPGKAPGPCRPLKKALEALKNDGVFGALKFGDRGAWSLEVQRPEGLGGPAKAMRALDP